MSFFMTIHSLGKSDTIRTLLCRESSWFSRSSYAMRTSKVRASGARRQPIPLAERHD